MSNYYHGAKASKQATSVSTPVVADSSIHLIVCLLYTSPSPRD